MELVNWARSSRASLSMKGALRLPARTVTTSRLVRQRDEQNVCARFRLEADTRASGQPSKQEANSVGAPARTIAFDAKRLPGHGRDETTALATDESPSRPVRAP